MPEFQQPIKANLFLDFFNINPIYEDISPVKDEVKQHDDSYFQFHTSKIEQCILLEQCTAEYMRSTQLAKIYCSTRHLAKKLQVSMPGIVPLHPGTSKSKPVTFSSVAPTKRDNGHATVSLSPPTIEPSTRPVPKDWQTNTPCDMHFVYFFWTCQIRSFAHLLLDNMSCLTHIFIIRRQHLILLSHICIPLVQQPWFIPTKSRQWTMQLITKRCLSRCYALTAIQIFFTTAAYQNVCAVQEQAQLTSSLLTALLIPTKDILHATSYCRSDLMKYTAQLHANHVLARRDMNLSQTFSRTLHCLDKADIPHLPCSQNARRLADEFFWWSNPVDNYGSPQDWGVPVSCSWTESSGKDSWSIQKKRRQLRTPKPAPPPQQH